MTFTGNTREFKLDLEKFIKNMEGDVDRAVKKIALDVFTSVVKKTPVDTGRARSSWNVGIGAPDLSVTPEGINAGESGATARALSKAIEIERFRLGQTIYLTNNLPYILALEDGHSQRQAPFGMVEVTLAEFRAGLIGRTLRRR